MKIFKRHSLSIQEAELLIEKYYEGTTTGAEESQIREFLTQKNLPEQFYPEREIFGYFAKQKQKVPIQLKPAWRWAAVASVAVIFALSAILFYKPAETSFAYVDGKKITDQQIIKSLALSSVGNLNSGMGEMNESLENIKTNNMIENQLDAFEGIEF